VKIEEIKMGVFNFQKRFFLFHEEKLIEEEVERLRIQN
jgi:hypothetical protein